MKGEFKAARAAIPKEMQTVEPAKTNLRGKRHDAIEITGAAAKLDRPRALAAYAQRLQILQQPRERGFHVEDDTRGLRLFFGVPPNPWAKV